MAIIKRMSSKAHVGKVEKYLKRETSEDKIDEKLISGVYCSGDYFTRECQVTNLLHNKNNTNDERKYYHIIQSFSPDDNPKLTPEKAHKIGLEFAEKNFKGHEVLVVTHVDKKHKHNHFIVNSISLDTGKKYRADNKSLWQMRKHSNELCEKNELTHSIQNLDKRSKDKYKSGEIRKAERNEDVWKINLKAQIETIAKTATSFEQFKDDLSQKFKVDVQERTRKSKGKTEILYEYKPEGNKKYCGEYRLGTDYGKENVDGLIRRNQEKTRTESTRDTGTDPRGTNGIRHAEFIEFELKQREQELADQDKEINTSDRKTDPRGNNKIETRDFDSEIRSRKNELSDYELKQRERKLAKQAEKDKQDGERNESANGKDKGNTKGNTKYYQDR